MHITLRPIESDDRSFLIDLYAATRAAELAMVPWSDEQKRSFVESQFNAQDTHYRLANPAASFDVVLCDGLRAGRLLVSRGDTDVRVIDIALAPEFQGQGIGGSLLRSVMSDAAATGCSVSLHVERFNAAANWYRSLGFFETSVDAVYLAMRWSPPL